MDACTCDGRCLSKALHWLMLLLVEATLGLLLVGALGTAREVRQKQHGYEDPSGNNASLISGIES